MPAISTGLAIGLIGASAAAGVGTAAIGAHAAGKAADAQSQAAIEAAQLQKQAADEALAFQKQVFGTQQAEIAPYLQTGYGALANLSNLLGISPSGGASTPGAAGGPFPAGSLGAPIPMNGSPAMATVDASGQPLGQFAGGNTVFGKGVSGVPPLLGGANQMTAGRLSMMDGGDWTGGPTIDVGDRTGGVMPGPAQLAPGTGRGVNLSSLVNPALGARGSLLSPFGENFQAPTNVTEQTDPGYQFRLDQGMKALQNSAAARGSLLTGGTAKDITDYAQNYASNEYSNVYGRQLGEYQQRYNIFKQQQGDVFNRLSAMAGLGQTATGQLTSAGNFAAGNIGNLLLGSAGQIGSSLQNAAAARASGYVGGANAIGTGISGATGGITQAILLRALLGGSVPSGSPPV